MAFCVEFWGFWSCEEVLQKLGDEGMRLTWFMFQALEIPTYQDQYMALKPTFMKLFKEYDRSMYSSTQPFSCAHFQKWMLHYKLAMSNSRLCTLYVGRGPRIYGTG